MEALTTAFAAALLAGWSDRGQLVAAALAAQGVPLRLVIAVALLAYAAVALVAAAGGLLMRGVAGPRALGLLVAIALLYAGTTGLFGRSTVSLERLRLGPLATTAAALFASALADRAPFLTAVLAARWDAALLSAAGATAGGTLAIVPAALLGARVAALPLRTVEIATSLTLLLAGLLALLSGTGFI